MPAPIPRHNINLTAAQRRLLVRLACGGRARSGSRAAFAADVGAWLGGRRVVALDSARTATAVALRALGVVPGDRVVLPARCFFTLPLVVRALGGEPVFAPVDRSTHALDPGRLASLLPGASAVVLIHPFGQFGPAPEVAELARSAGVPLLEDASQSTGAGLAGRRAGSFGAAAVFSLVSGKNLQTFGGGLLAVEPELADRVAGLLVAAREPGLAAVRARLRSGLVNWALTTRVGFSFGAYPAFRVLSALDRERLDARFREAREPLDGSAPPVWLSAAQADLGRLDLLELDRRNARRRRNALRLLAGLKGISGLGLPRFDRVAENAFNAVAVQVDDARALARRLLRRGVDTREDYMDWYPARPAGARELLYLPNHPGMSRSAVDQVIAAVRAASTI